MIGRIRAVDVPRLIIGILILPPLLWLWWPIWVTLIDRHSPEWMRFTAFAGLLAADFGLSWLLWRLIRQWWTELQ
jgi:hypothetical protein